MLSMISSESQFLFNLIIVYYIIFNYFIIIPHKHVYLLMEEKKVVDLDGMGGGGVLGRVEGGEP